MKKASHAVTLPLSALQSQDRRAFCQALAAGAATVVLTGCRPPMAGTDAEELGADAASRPVDLARRSDLSTPPDLATSPDLVTPPDLGVPLCGAGIVDTGRSAASFPIDTATYFMGPRAFVCRDAAGWFAMTAICTHAGCIIGVDVGQSFLCPCHASRYDFDGAVLGGPAALPLSHFAMCRTAAGTVGFDPSSIVKSTERYLF